MSYLIINPSINYVSMHSGKKYVKQTVNFKIVNENLQKTSAWGNFYEWTIANYVWIHYIYHMHTPFYENHEFRSYGLASANSTQICITEQLEIYTVASFSMNFKERYKKKFRKK